VIIEREGEPKKIFRVTLPLGVDLARRTSIAVDNNAPVKSPYVICLANGCMSDYEVTPELLTNMTKGQNLVVQGIDSGGTPLSLPLPLAEFAKAYNGPPTDIKVFLQEDLQRRAAAKASGLPSPTAAPAPASPPPAPQISATTPGRIAPAGRRVALVIGNSAYQNAQMLPNPKRDAAAVADALEKVGFQSVVLQTDLSREKLVDALRAFATQAENADWAVVYYAGHGIEAAGVNYLIPVDARISTDRDINLEAVSIDQVLNSVERARALRLVVLDACRDNPFANQMKRTMTDASRSVSRGLARVEPDPGTLVVFAAKHGETALDGNGLNSPFVTAFVKDIQVPGVEVRRLFDNIRDDVMEITNRQQQPYAYGSVPGRQDFYFTAK
jgi:hypothetical protein